MADPRGSLIDSLRHEEALKHLGCVIEAYDDADEHIREKLQPEFERLGEHRLATWWHGFYLEVDRAKEFLGGLRE